MRLTWRERIYSTTCKRKVALSIFLSLEGMSSRRASKLHTGTVCYLCSAPLECRQSKVHRGRNLPFIYAVSTPLLCLDMPRTSLLSRGRPLSFVCLHRVSCPSHQATLEALWCLTRKVLATGEVFRLLSEIMRFCSTGGITEVNSELC